MRIISRVPQKFPPFFAIVTAIVVCAIAVRPTTLTAQNPVNTAKKAAADMAKKLMPFKKLPPKPKRI
jgi:hypothetical protein